MERACAQQALARAPLAREHAHKLRSGGGWQVLRTHWLEVEHRMRRMWWLRWPWGLRRLRRLRWLRWLRWRLRRRRVKVRRLWCR